MARPGRRAPAERHAAIVGGKQIETAIDRDPKAEPGTGAEVQHAHAALRPVGVLEQLDPGELLQRAGALVDARARPVPSEQLDHGASSRFRASLSRLVDKVSRGRPSSKSWAVAAARRLPALWPVPDGQAQDPRRRPPGQAAGRNRTAAPARCVRIRRRTNCKSTILSGVVWRLQGARVRSHLRRRRGPLTSARFGFVWFRCALVHSASCRIRVRSALRCARVRLARCAWGLTAGNVRVRSAPR
jgi:hypothetical protein